MRPSALRYALSCLCLATQLLGTAVGAGQMACVADDGHLAYEFAHPGDCTQESERHHGGTTASHAVSGCAGHGCTDIALLQPAWRKASSGDDTTHASSCDGCSPRAASFVALAALAPVFGTPKTVYVRSADLFARRTVVLLV